MSLVTAGRGVFRCALMLAAAGLPLIARPAAAQTAPIAAPNMPNINVTPRRIIFNARKRSEAVFVFNQGVTPITVDVSLLDNVMLPSGEIMPVTDALKRGGTAAELAKKIASARLGMIVSPSRLLLAAGKGRTVRVRAPIGDEAIASETRSHLTITTVPPPSTGLTAEQAAEAARRGELAFNVQTIFGVSIPLIVRTGSPTAQVSFGPVALVQEQATPPARGATPILVIPINRTGAKSVYGNLEVRAGKGKASQVIGLARGLGVYTELNQRTVRLQLSRQPRSGEVLSITYYDDEGLASNAKLASTDFVPR